MSAFKKECRGLLELNGRSTPKRRSLLCTAALDTESGDVVKALGGVDIGSVCMGEWAVTEHGRVKTRAKDKASGAPPRSRGRNIMGWKHVLARRGNGCFRSNSWCKRYIATQRRLVGGRHCQLVKRCSLDGDGGRVCGVDNKIQRMERSEGKTEKNARHIIMQRSLRDAFSDVATQAMDRKKEYAQTWRELLYFFSNGSARGHAGEVTHGVSMCKVEYQSSPTVNNQSRKIKNEIALLQPLVKTFAVGVVGVERHSVSQRVLARVIEQANP